MSLAMITSSSRLPTHHWCIVGHDETGQSRLNIAQVYQQRSHSEFLFLNPSISNSARCRNSADNLSGTKGVTLICTIRLIAAETHKVVLKEVCLTSACTASACKLDLNARCLITSYGGAKEMSANTSNGGRGSPLI
eukprot:3911773-Amphidinium_carterae.1